MRVFSYLYRPLHYNYKMRIILTSIFFLLLSQNIFGQSCDVEGIQHSTFSDIQTILDDNDCSSCHNKEDKIGGWEYSTYDAMLKTGICGQPTIIHGNASQSYLFTRILGGDNECGESNDNHTVSEVDLQRIESWINFGAPEKCLPFYNDIVEVFDGNGCQSCHNSSNEQSWHYQTYDDMTGPGTDDNCENMSNVIKGNASSSLLYQKIANGTEAIACGEVMEGTEGPLSSEELIKVRDWINGGALESEISLPVELNSFNVSNIDSRIKLEWSTAIENATDRFIIERSPSGRNFQEIGIELSKGSSTVSTDYEFIDESPVYGSNYYRLKIVDLDGSYDYSNIRLATSNIAEPTLVISPNPAHGSERLKVKWFSGYDRERAYLNIVDVNGQNFARKIIFEGTNYVRLPRLLDGVYYIIIEDHFDSYLLERVVIIN